MPRTTDKRQNIVSRIHYQVMWNRLLSVVEEQAQTLVRTAFGASTREAGDLSAAIFLPDGSMIAQAVTGTPGHVNSVAEAVRHFLVEFAAETMRPGDIYFTNDPWKGTGHLNDFTVVTPVFKHKRLVALFACTVHVVDIGGLGSGPDGMEIYHEGLFIPIVPLAVRGRIQRDVLKIIAANVREPVQVEGDLYALMACNDFGAWRLLKMMDEFRLRSIEGLGRHIIDQSRKGMLNAIREWPRGTYTSSMTIDGYDHPLILRAEVTISGSGIDVDFEGTSPVSAYGINVPKSYTDAYTTFGIRCIIGPAIPNNSGSLSVIRVSAPEGSILNAPHPRAVSARSAVGQMLPDVVFGCLRQAREECVPAEGASSLWNIRISGGRPMKGVHGSEVLGTRFNVVCYNTGGTGARPTKDGLSTTSFPSGVRNVAIEIIETLTPLVFRRKEYRCDSGGAGRYRGGLGQIIEISHAENAPMQIAASFERIEHPARGCLGGKNGATGRVRLASGKSLKGMGRQVVPAGDRLIVETAGGGGFGDPRERDPASIAEDLKSGLTSEEKAKLEYHARRDEEHAKRQFVRKS